MSETTIGVESKKKHMAKTEEIKNLKLSKSIQMSLKILLWIVIGISSTNIFGRLSHGRKF